MLLHSEVFSSVIDCTFIMMDMVFRFNFTVASFSAEVAASMAPTNRGVPAHDHKRRRRRRRLRRRKWRREKSNLWRMFWSPQRTSARHSAPTYPSDSPSDSHTYISSPFAPPPFTWTDIIECLHSSIHAFIHNCYNTIWKELHDGYTTTWTTTEMNAFAHIVHTYIQTVNKVTPWL